jgi:hypothetical protein
MDAERFFKIMLTSLTSDLLILEEELERTINSNIDTNSKIEKVKTLLKNISLTENSVSKFQNMITNNNKQILNENGKI